MPTAILIITAITTIVILALTFSKFQKYLFYTDSMNKVLFVNEKTARERLDKLDRLKELRKNAFINFLILAVYSVLMLTTFVCVLFLTFKLRSL